MNTGPWSEATRQFYEREALRDRLRAIGEISPNKDGTMHFEQGDYTATQLIEVVMLIAPGFSVVGLAKILKPLFRPL